MDGVKEVMEVNKVMGFTKDEGRLRGCYTTHHVGYRIHARMAFQRKLDLLSTETVQTGSF